MDKKFLNSSLELWGGIECTINRIDDFYHDQLHYAKHYSREGDIELIASLGIKTLRHPILWEFHQPHQNQPIDWSWPDKQMDKLEEQGITPIAGFLHHGSGPEFTNLLDPEFPQKLAEYAGQVACRYPSIQYYTPVNEPLTTARFSGLYGLWYPHKQNDISFARMLLNQIKGIVLSMEAIRKVNPSAKLVQTEDLGKTYSSPSLSYQAKFENERRWLTYDLLCGRLKPGHPMWAYFSRLGISPANLEFFLDNPCPPDIMGFNHYITSERFLDENLEPYPSYTHGGNEVQEYADVEAVRVPHCKRNGLKILLKEAWDRFRLPIAITEAQLNCTREEQLRWLQEIWETCEELREEDINIKAVTAWALLGAFGWKTLLTSKKMDYEPGAFDIRSGTPRPTALNSLIRSLATGSDFNHPVLQQKGWWHREIRNEERLKIQMPSEASVQPILIIGKKGTPGKAFAHTCASRAISYVLIGREDLDITNPNDIEAAISRYHPWAIVNADGFFRVEDIQSDVNADGFFSVEVSESDTEIYYRINTIGPQLLAIAAKKHAIRFMLFSPTVVFNGTERHTEITVLKENEESLIIRMNDLLIPMDEYNFMHDEALDLLIDEAKGIWHLTKNFLMQDSISL